MAAKKVTLDKRNLLSWFGNPEVTKPEIYRVGDVPTEGSCASPPFPLLSCDSVTLPSSWGLRPHSQEQGVRSGLDF